MPTLAVSDDHERQREEEAITVSNNSIKSFRVLDEARATVLRYHSEYFRPPGDDILRTCFHHLKVLMDGPSVTGYQDSLNTVLYHYSCPVLMACTLALHKHVSDEQLFNLLNATMDHALCSNADIFARYMTHDKFDFILTLGQKNENRRLWLFNCACKWEFFEEDGEVRYWPEDLEVKTAVKLAQLLYPLDDANAARQLSMISECCFEKWIMHWEGLRYTIHLESVRQRILNSDFDINKVFWDVNPVCKVLRILRSFDDTDSRRVTAKILYSVSPYTLRGPFLSDCDWFTYFHSVDYDLLFTTVLRPYGALRWLISRFSQYPGMSCANCRAYTGYYLLLLMDGDAFKRYSQTPPCNWRMEPVSIECIMEGAVKWFLQRPRDLPMDLLRLWRYLLERRGTLSDVEVRLLAPVYAEIERPVEDDLII